MRMNCDCGRTLTYDSRHIGKKVRCAGCRQILIPPDPDAPILEPIEEEPTRRLTTKERAKPVPELVSRRKRPTDDEEDERPVSRSRRRDDDDEEVDDRPRRRRRDDDDEDMVEDRPKKRRPKRKASSSSGGGLGTLGALLCNRFGLTVIILMVIGGVGAVASGVREGMLANRSKDVPRQVTLDQLVATGLADNAHVVVTGAHPSDNFVYQVKVRKNESTVGKPWSEVYVPLLPTPNASGAIKVIMLSRKAKNQGDLGRIFSQGRIQGMLINSIASLDSETQKLLRGSYPGTNFDSVLILEEGRGPSSAGYVMLLLVGGAVLIVLGAILGLVALFFRPA